MVIALVLSAALAQDHEPLEIVDLDGPSAGADGPFAASGHRIRGFGGSHGVAIGEQIVVGGDGGVSVTTLVARVRYGDFSMDARLPFAAYAAASGRDTGLGNLQVEGRYQLESGAGFEHALGALVTLNPGGQPYTWATRADELWPGGGVDAVWEVRSSDLGSTTVLGRSSFGVHGSRGFAPVPKVWPRFEAVAGVDQGIGEVGGVIVEAAIAYWDVAPFELSGFLRADPTDGLRLRGGLVMPMATWFGWEPTGRPGGVRELTLSFQVQAAI